MDTCQYCQKIITDNEESKTFFFQKKQKCHLDCYQNQKKNKLTPRVQWMATPKGVCPYCQKAIQNGEESKTFRSQKKKPCHLECYQKRPGRSWANLWWIIEMVVMFCLFVLSFIY